MDRLHVEGEASTRATPATVWALVSDARRYPEWGPWGAAGFRTPARTAGPASGRSTGSGHRPAASGATSPRSSGSSLFEPDRHLAYEVVGGMPVRNYRADVTLTPEAGGTHITWAATFDSTVLGRLVWRQLRLFYPEIVATLAAAAERLQAPPPRPADAACGRTRRPGRAAAGLVRPSGQAYREVESVVGPAPPRPAAVPDPVGRRSLRGNLGRCRAVLLAPHTPPNPSSQFRMDVSWSDGIATVAAHGRLDAAAAQELTARLSEIIEVVRPRRLVVDLADVPYVGRSGALALIAASAELPAPAPSS